jgi:hypothetical protein
MIKKLLPVIFLFVGVGAGVGAGIVLRPAPVQDVAQDGESEVKSPAEDLAVKEADSEDLDTSSEYIKLSNQFVVPLVTDERISALVVLALSIEIPFGQAETLLSREPKLRDSFLQVLFDHANIGGFAGTFTDAEVLGQLRVALREVAQRDVGKDLARDVLIVEIARQDY